jgi:hypothetical protein
LELDWVGVGTWEIRDDQFTGSGLGPSPSNILTAAWRDVQRIRLYRSPAYLARVREQTSTSYANELLQNLVRSWDESELPFRAKPFALLLWFRKTLHEIFRLTGGAEEVENLDAIQLAIEHIDRLSELNRLQESDS